MSSLSFPEKKLLESLLGMGGGYVLDFRDREFSSFFRDYKINIDHPKYHEPYGSSKAKRLRSFWEKESDEVVGSVLAGLFQMIDAEKINSKHRKIIERLSGKQATREVTVDEFLGIDFSGISISKIPIDQTLVPILESRLSEAQKCLSNGAPLATIFMSGSILEGVLLGMASANPEKFNRASSSPKDRSGKVLPIYDWTLAALIDVCCELKYLKVDVKKFSHALRDFRNYIHPYEQLASGFQPDDNTARICLQVLRAAIAELSGDRN